MKILKVVYTSLILMCFFTCHAQEEKKEFPDLLNIFRYREIEAEKIKNKSPLDRWIELELKLTTFEKKTKKKRQRSLIDELPCYDFIFDIMVKLYYKKG